jgi:ATP-dependent DNA ligase
MIKVKRFRTADCVVGGFRYASRNRQVGTLLLGLYDADGKLDHVGFTSTITDADRAALTRKLERLRGRP